ncbi:hypothetical protein K438DRAFT_1873264, partial [Mycena galopus ATCC 62051]
PVQFFKSALYRKPTLALLSIFLPRGFLELEPSGDASGVRHQHAEDSRSVSHLLNSLVNSHALESSNLLQSSRNISLL